MPRAPQTTRRGFVASLAASLASGLAGVAWADEAVQAAESAQDAQAQGDASSSDTDVADASDAFGAGADASPTTADAASSDADAASGPIDASNQTDSDGNPYGQPDDDGNIGVIATFMDVMDQVDYEPISSFTLPVGCVPYVSCDSWAAVVQANTDGRTFTRLGCLNLSSGEYTILLEQGVTGKGWAVSEARITDNMVLWVEQDNATLDWALYACSFTGAAITQASTGISKLAEGDSDWLLPQFDASGAYAVWQVMPDPSGPRSKEHSHAYIWTLGSSQGEELWDSPGRFGCAPSISDRVVTIAPRVNADEGVYYGITALSLVGQHVQLDQLVLPASVKPLFATYIGSSFAFSIEADYGYGGRLGSMGYCIGPGEGPFHYVLREPAAQVCNVGGLYVVKSRVSYFVVDIERMTYARISAASGCTDYGDYPATQGTTDRFVTFATIKDGTSGIPASVLVRIFSLS